MTKEPSRLTLSAVLAMHDQVLAEHGGSAAVRDLGLLESALAAPKNRYAYGDQCIFALATAYAYAITRNHPFMDGNKRTAFLAAYTFLGINGWELNTPEDAVVHAVVGLSDRTLSAEAFTEWLRTACRKPRRSTTE